MNFITTPFGSITANQPITLNVGASYGPRVSTAGFEWGSAVWPKRIGWSVSLYADLDGNLWQDDGDVIRRGAQALVSFAYRGAAKIRAGEADTETLAPTESNRWAVVKHSYTEVVEGFERRLQASATFTVAPGQHLTDLERHWLEQVAGATHRMGKGLHVGLTDERNRRVFGLLKAA